MLKENKIYLMLWKNITTNVVIIITSKNSCKPYFIRRFILLDLLAFLMFWIFLFQTYMVPLRPSDIRNKLIENGRHFLKLMENIEEKAFSKFFP